MEQAMTKDDKPKTGAAEEQRTVSHPSSGNIEIETSDGRRWPCRLTLGAMRRYKRETGEDVSRMKDTSDMGVLVWCCCQSACSADGIAMDVGLDDFLDRLEPRSLAGFSQLLSSEKKTMM